MPPEGSNWTYPNQLRVQLGNDVAIKAYREGTLPFPDGTIVIALHWKRVCKSRDRVFTHYAP